MKKRYAQVGIGGGRAGFYYEAIAGPYKDSAELVAMCDINPGRMETANKILKDDFQYNEVPMYTADRFDDMIRETKPDVVIVTSIDRTHHKYIIRAMELGCDVMTEKPLTMTAERCQDIIDAQKRTGRNIRVCFNYRYAPLHTKIREVIMNGTIGEVFSIHFEWLLDINHGADYFRRWHRDKKNSGGLLVHKATHHFDLVNFWIDSQPKTVFAFGDLNFYGRENAEKRGITNFYYRGTDNEYAEKDFFGLDLHSSEDLKRFYLDNEKYDGYLRDQSVFGDGISIEDTMGVLVKYKNNAIMTYSLNAYMPREGYKISINGSKGRIEVLNVENSYISAGNSREEQGAVLEKELTVFPINGESYKVEIDEGKGAHGGGDIVLLNDLFGTPVEDPFHRAAGVKDGAMSILTGIAANKSIATGLPVDVDSLVKF